MDCCNNCTKNVCASDVCASDSSHLETIRHSAAHVLAAAVLRLFPLAKIDIGPSTDTGFYYDIDLEHKFTIEDLQSIENEMVKIINENIKIERFVWNREEAQKFFEKTKQSYKLERLADIPDGETISVYKIDEFVDLCRGPHVGKTGEIKAVKLLNVSGSYYRGNEKLQQLQRIHGTAFDSKEKLNAYLEQIEEAKKRDHRKLGKELKLFVIDETVGRGLVLWTPNGTIVRQELQKFITEELDKYGYVQVQTPHIGKLDLFRTSGHFPYYKESQFSPILDKDVFDLFSKQSTSTSDIQTLLEKGELDGFLLKPMNCPFHVALYKSDFHSYRDLPIRMAEFGTVYRWEQSGELNGLIRVFGFTQDDAHIFCTEDQLHEEIKNCLKIVKTVFSTLGMKEFSVRLSLRDPDSDKYIGDDNLWEKSENALRESIQGLGFSYVEKKGEAAFYGPKIDFIVKDVIGREWQLGTVQVDYNLPNRFDLSYVGQDNQPHRPVMIHRAPFGSLERFFGILIEHFAGNFPVWLSPEQVRILPINDDLIPYADSILKILKSKKIRASVDHSSAKLGAKIRQSELNKVPYMLVIGKKEYENESVTVRSRYTKEIDGKSMTVSNFTTHILSEISERKLNQ